MGVTPECQVTRIAWYAPPGELSTGTQNRPSGEADRSLPSGHPVLNRECKILGVTHTSGSAGNSLPAIGIPQTGSLACYRFCLLPYGLLAPEAISLSGQSFRMSPNHPWWPDSAKRLHVRADREGSGPRGRRDQDMCVDHRRFHAASHDAPNFSAARQNSLQRSAKIFGAPNCAAGLRRKIQRAKLLCGALEKNSTLQIFLRRAEKIFSAPNWPAEG